MKELTYSTAPKLVKDVFWVIDKNFSVDVEDAPTFLSSYDNIRHKLMMVKAEPEAVILLTWIKQNIESLTVTNNGYFKVGLNPNDVPTFLRDTLPELLQPVFKNF